MGLLRRTTEKLRTELDGYERGRELLQRRLASARTDLETNNTLRRDLLLREAPDERAIDRANEAARAIESRIAGLEDAMLSLAGRVADANARLAAMIDDEERERVAAQIEANAKRIEAGAAELDAAAAEYGRVRRAVRGLADELAPKPDSALHGAGAAIVIGGDVVAGAKTVSALSEIAFGLSPTATAAAAKVATEMCERAAAIRAGTAVPIVNPSGPVQRLRAPATFPERAIALTRPAIYLGAMNGRVDLPAGGVNVPSLIAERAIAAGVAFPAESREGRQITTAIQSAPAGTLERTKDGNWIATTRHAYMGERQRQEEARHLTPEERAALAEAARPYDLGALYPDELCRAAAE